MTSRTRLVVTVGAIVLAALSLVGWAVTGSSARDAPVHDAAVTHGDPPFGINVTAAPYGAHCDGWTDDTAALQAALDAAPATGARVQVPATSAGCKITSTLTVPQNVILEGETPKTEIWYASPGNGPAIRIGTTTGTSPADQRGGGLKDIGVMGFSASGAYPGQVGVQISRAVNVVLDNTWVEDTGIAYQVDGGPAGDWSGELTFLDPKASNVVTGLQTTDSGGYITDTRVVGGYLFGVSTGTGRAFDLRDLHSSQFSLYSEEHFAAGVYVTGSGGDNTFFGGRSEQSGARNGTTSYVCDGAGRADVFYGPRDSDVAVTEVTNLDGAACTQR
jgi:hypothetical protein